MSLDRIDSSKGYVEDNICITTIAINIAKNDLSKEDFIEMCKKVANNFTFPEQQGGGINFKYLKYKFSVTYQIF